VYAKEAHLAETFPALATLISLPVVRINTAAEPFVEPHFSRNRTGRSPYPAMFYRCRYAGVRNRSRSRLWAGRQRQSSASVQVPAQHGHFLCQTAPRLLNGAGLRLQGSLLRGLNSAPFASNSARINLARSKAGQEIGEGAGRAIATRRLSEEIRIDSFPGRRRFDVTLNRQRER